MTNMIKKFLLLTIFLIFCLSVGRIYASTQNTNNINSETLIMDTYNAFKQKNFTKVLKLADIGIEFESKNPPKVAGYLTFKGVAQYELGKYRESIESYSKALELLPNNADIYQNRALSYLALYDYQNAKSDYEKALQIDPNHAVAKEQYEEMQKNQTYYMIKQLDKSR